MSTGLLHPIRAQLEALGVQDKSEQERIIAVYNDLFDVKLWPELKLVLHPEQGKAPLLIGRSSLGASYTVVVPRSSESPLSLLSLHTQTALIQSHYSTPSIMIALVDSDASIVYYNLSATNTPPNYKGATKQQATSTA